VQLRCHQHGRGHDVGARTGRGGLGEPVGPGKARSHRAGAAILRPDRQPDQSEATSALDTTVDLVTFVAGEYSIDKNRLYTTGQSGGAMMSIAIDIKYPDLF